MIENTEYINHLTEITRVNNVVVKDNIINEKGVLVAKANTIMDQQKLAILSQHKLATPLENSISLEKNISSLISIRFFEKRKSCLEISKIMLSSGLFQDNNNPFKILTRLKTVDQKLTVMFIRFPQIFDRIIFMSIITLQICRELKLEPKHTEQVFVASLLADTGLLHLPQALIEKTERYTDAENNMMQSHPVIAKYIADIACPSLKVISRAVLEHHERSDGFGYPFAKSEDKLGLEGQIIAMADQTTGLYSKLVVKEKYSWQAVADVIQLQTSANTQAIRNAILRILKKMEGRTKNRYSIDESPALIKKLTIKYEKLKEWFEVLESILTLHKSELNESKNFRPFALLHQLDRLIANSGLLSEVQFEWLSCLELPPSTSDMLDIEDYELKLDEVEYQCFFVMRKLRESREELAQRLNSEELATHYDEELTNIITRDS